MVSFEARQDANTFAKFILNKGLQVRVDNVPRFESEHEIWIVHIRTVLFITTRESLHLV